MSDTTVLIILDGWGYSSQTNHNAIHHAKTPCWDGLIANYPHTLLTCSGTSVGLPKGQMGNSEVGHMTMGAGRVILQDLARINLAIEDGGFFDNPNFINAINTATRLNKKIHVMGLLSEGGVHSHEQHVFALLKLCANHSFKNILIHAFLDGRDTPPKSATQSLLKLQATIDKLKVGKIATISGRYYSMDRDKRYNRTKQVYDLLTDPNYKPRFSANDVITGLENAYARDETDEFVLPTAINFDQKTDTIKNDDIAIFLNFRADRAKQLSYALMDKNFNGFPRVCFPKLNTFISLTEYATDLQAKIAFPKDHINYSLGEVIQNNRLSQLRLAETEKYAHVTFFFNGGRDIEFKNETRILVPSPKVATYDLKPEMSAIPVTDNLVAAIKSQQYNFILCNYANADMVGHTGDFNAAIKSVEAIDKCLTRVVKELRATNSTAIITADHGNVELMHNQDNNQPHTAHSNNLVPCVYIGNNKDPVIVNPKVQNPSLQDVAPTILRMLGVEKPMEMRGNSIFLAKKDDNNR